MSALIKVLNYNYTKNLKRQKCGAIVKHSKAVRILCPINSEEDTGVYRTPDFMCNVSDIKSKIYRTNHVDVLSNTISRQTNSMYITT